MIHARRAFHFACPLLLLTTLVTFPSAQQISPALYQGMRWRLIGPFRAGRTVAISGVRGQQNVFYMAANNGGVWKSADYGLTWRPIFDDQDTGSIGALAVAPSNPEIIYVGSGEGLRRPDLSIGDGIYKSTDAGSTWQHLGLRDAQQIGAILVDPHDPNRVLVAALGHPYGPNEERGVFRSLDGGVTWQKVLYKDVNTGAIDLVFDPTNAQTVYAVMWASRRPPWTTGGAYGAAGSGLYKSTDGGATWQPLTGGLPSSPDLGRIGLAIAASDPRRMYALVQSAKAGGLYRSDDAGATWQSVNTEERIYGRGDDFACVRVHPQDRDTIFVANTSTYRSTDAGRNFTAIKGAPGGDDYHTIWINPENPDILALAVDQGATITVNGGESWSSWYNQPTAQFYHVITDNQFPYWVYGGQQESGSVGTASRGDFGEITFRDWYPVGVEEYGYVAPDPLDPNIIYGGKATRFSRLTGQTQDVSPVVLRTGKYRFNRTAPLIFSVADPHALYLGSNVLFKTTDGGNTWQEISPDLTREDPGVPPGLGPFTESDPAQGKHRGVIYSIAPSPKDTNLIWIGTDDGLIQVTTDGGMHWQNVTPPELTAWSKLAQLDASHFDTATVYGAVNRFRLDDLHPYVYRTHDGGRTWQKIVTGIPEDEPVNTVREDPERKGLLFAGTERTVYVSFDDGDHWQSLRLNLPATSIRDLVVHQDDIVVGTHGRSFWILDDITALRQANARVAESNVHLFAPQVTYRVRRDNNSDTPLPPEIPAGQNPPEGAIVDYWLRAAASGPVTMEMVDASGKLVRRFSSEDKPDVLAAKEINIPTYWIRPPRTLSTQPGMHRFVWDLHYPPPPALEREYPISAIYHDTPLYPLGPAVLPGAYTVRLTVNGQTYSQPLTVNMDPRVRTSPQDLRSQFEISTAIVDAMQRDFAARAEVRNLRAQLKELQQSVRGKPPASAITALDQKVALLEGSTGGYGASFLATPAGRSLARLNVGFSNLLSTVNSADAAPTSQALAMSADLNNALGQQLALLDEILKKDVPALNAQLKKAGQTLLKSAPHDQADAPR
ncbi:MAG TPA: glycoside hydrolase [Terriglobales bacterium]|nr:glycoside hydrolase [Terriglobales bacterium]